MINWQVMLPISCMVNLLTSRLSVEWTAYGNTPVEQGTCAAEEKADEKNAAGK